MKKEDAEEFTQSLGQIVGGSYRMLLHARKLGVHKALGIQFDEWVNQRLGGYVQHPDRQQKVIELKHEGHSNRAIADALGVDKETVRRDLDGANAPYGNHDRQIKQELTKEDGANAPSTVAEKRKAGEDARKAILEVQADPEIAPGIYVEDFFTGSDRIADDSVDLIFTDPPYDKDSVDLYRKAAKVAARILKPGGSFVAYSGQKYLPEVYGLINHPALRYWWTFAGVHAGANQMLQKLGIRCGWKPIIWYVKGTRGDVSEVLTDVVTGAREKTHHEWQQAEAEALHFIEKLTFPGGLVVDLFFGGGTTKVAADKLSRRFIGFEIERAVAERAMERLAEKVAA
jgi:SAM-dependent methyltransferase